MCKRCFKAVEYHASMLCFMVKMFGFTKRSWSQSPIQESSLPGRQLPRRRMAVRTLFDLRRLVLKLSKVRCKSLSQKQIKRSNGALQNSTSVLHFIFSKRFQCLDICVATFPFVLLQLLLHVLLHVLLQLLLFSSMEIAFYAYIRAALTKPAYTIGIILESSD